MMARRELLLGAGGALALSGCSLLPFRKSTFHFRMHVDVMTPQGLRSGNGVLGLISEKAPTFGIATSHGGTSLIGEAVIVELPDGPLFTLLRRPGAADSISLANMILDAMAPRDPQDVSADTGIDQNRHVAWAREGSIRADLPAELPDPWGEMKPAWPMMVRFGDLNDPKSVEAVDPQATGVKRVWVENTGAALTSGIEKRMPPWFMKLYREKARFSGSNSIAITTNNLADELGPDSFSTEISG
jgi:hypothetical protein